MNRGYMPTAKRGDWGTPRWLFDELAVLTPFDLDAAASEQNTLCKRYITKNEDALDPSTPWIGRHIWINPPYGHTLWRWLDRAQYEIARERHERRTATLLLPARTDTKWFHDYVMKSNQTKSCIFIEGRLTFVGAYAPAPFPSVIVEYSNEPKTGKMLIDFLTLSARGRK